jgi:hypothetical protein
MKRSWGQKLLQMKYQRRRDPYRCESLRSEGPVVSNRRYTKLRPDKLRSTRGNPTVAERTHNQPQILPGSKALGKMLWRDARNRDNPCTLGRRVVGGSEWIGASSQVLHMVVDQLQIAVTREKPC